MLLPELSDVDEPADLELWQNIAQASRRVSVIVPALNEAQQLPATLEAAAAVLKHIAQPWLKAGAAHMESNKPSIATRSFISLPAR